MYRVSDEQIEFILNDIKQRGVEMEDLQLNLLDHICCILEQELTEEQNFETVYQKVIKQFFKHELWEIEEETIFLLKYKNYYKMKRLLYILLFLSIGYNVFVLTKVAYESYEERKWINGFQFEEKVTLKEGYEELIERLKAEHPAVLKKDYLCVNFIGDPMSKIQKELFHFEMDTSWTKLNKNRWITEYKSMDSVAGIYNKNTAFILAYIRSDDLIDKKITENKTSFKNLISLDGQKKLVAGYYNDKKQKTRFLNILLVFDKSGRMIYDCKYISQKHIFLSRFLKTLPN